jgi:RNA polymerase sigma-70 factor (ECF subfamily)
LQLDVSADAATVWSELSAAELEHRLDSLLALHGASLARLAGSYVKEAVDRDDLLQEISVAIWQALPRFRGECSERTFVFRIAHNRAIAFISRRHLPLGETDDGFDVEDGRPNPEEAMATGQQGQRLLDAIQRLPVSLRQVVTLALEGLSYAEIGDVLGISETNVGARLTRARQRLRQLLLLAAPAHTGGGE